jgi:hypothetical protein
MWDGVDVWPLLDRQAKQIESRAIYWNLRGSQFAIRNGDWKLIARESGGRWEGTELYAIGTDPHEATDVVSTHPDVAKRLLNMIAEERKLDGSSKRPDVDD